jgi:hypothetical protein
VGYITFIHIATSGDTGSQVLQYWSLCAIAKENNLEIVFPESMISAGWGFKFCKLLDININYKPDEFFKDFINININQKVKVDENLFNLDSSKNYNIVDLFLFCDYWYPKHSKLIENITWNKKYYLEAVNLFETIKIPNKELVSIHVRRGDYLLPQHHHFCKLDNRYYEEALQDFIKDIEKYHFIVFSNDIEWCKQHLIDGEMVTFMPQGIDYVDLIVMSMCNHNIIANSTYSLVAAYKNNNKNKKIICPTNYVKSYSEVPILNGNYYPQTWKNIDNDY